MWDAGFAMAAYGAIAGLYVLDHLETKDRTSQNVLKDIPKFLQPKRIMYIVSSKCLDGLWNLFLYGKTTWKEFVLLISYLYY